MNTEQISQEIARLDAIVAQLLSRLRQCQNNERAALSSAIQEARDRRLELRIQRARQAAHLERAQQPHAETIPPPERTVPDARYWGPSEPVGPPNRYFKSLRFVPLPSSFPDLTLALSKATTECIPDVHNLLRMLGGGAKFLMNVQVRYEPANPEQDSRPPMDFFLSAPATRIFQIQDGQNPKTNPYQLKLQLLADRILSYHAKFISEKSNLRLVKIHQLLLRASQYNPLAGGCIQSLPKFLEVIILIAEHYLFRFVYIIIAL